MSERFEVRQTGRAVTVRLRVSPDGALEERWVGKIMSVKDAHRLAFLLSNEASSAMLDDGMSIADAGAMVAGWVLGWAQEVK